MNFFINAIKPFIYILSSIITLTAIVTLLNFFDIFNETTLNISKIIIIIVSLIIGGFLVGKKSPNKGWLAGLKLSLVFIIFILLFNFLALGYFVQLSDLIYYFIIIISTIFGSMIGINTKK